LLMASTK